MSPTEDDLRTALSDGAGDTPDADDIVFAAGRQRAQQQKRWLSAAAAVIVVGGVATGATLLGHHGNEQRSAAGGGTNGEAHRASATGLVPAPSVAGGTDAVATSCPARVRTPLSAAGSAAGGTATGGTATGGTDAGGPLFSKPVASALVCAYPQAAEGQADPEPTSIRLTGADATTLTDSLEDATKVRPRMMCQDYRLDTQRTIVVLARATDGSQLPAVTTTINEPACAVVVSNGSTTRFDWAPPRALRQNFARLTPTGDPAGGLQGSTSTTGAPVGPSSPPVRLSGSPVH